MHSGRGNESVAHLKVAATKASQRHATHTEHAACGTGTAVGESAERKLDDMLRAVLRTGGHGAAFASSWDHCGRELNSLPR